MTKLVSIVFSALIIFQSLNISIEDVIKFNTLFEHANFHYEKYGDSFIDFFAEHYGSHMLNDDFEHKEHSKLPFKKDHQSCQHHTLNFIVHRTSFLPKQPDPVATASYFFYIDSNSLYEQILVFQPPKGLS